MDDLEAVLDAVGMERVALIAEVEPGLCAMYAATHPDRVTALVLANAAAVGGLALESERREAFGEVIENHWGEGGFLQVRMIPRWTWSRSSSRAGRPAASRRACSPR